MSSQSFSNASSQEVTLISNPTPSFAVFQWVPCGLRRLNRKNKLTSLPFWFPNNTMRKHQFRMVLLRGVVREDNEADDSVAVFLEYIPPPSEDGSGTTSGMSASPPAGPKGCKVTLRLLHRAGIDNGDRSNDIVEESTAVLDENEKQMVFREFISAKTLLNPDFVVSSSHADDDATRLSSTAVLEISILIGVNVVTQAVTATTNEVVGSLWSTFSAWGASVQSLVKKTVQVVQEQREEFEAALMPPIAAASGVGDPATVESEHASVSVHTGKHRELPWDDIPERWRGRNASWKRFVCEVLVEDENTFLIGSKRGISSDEQVLLTQYGVNHRAVMSADSVFDFNRDVHEGLLTLPSLRAQRYRLVPSRVKDEVFWANFMWKVYSLATCSTDDQAKLLLSVINAPPPVPQGSTSSLGSANGGGLLGAASTSASTVASNVQSFFQFAAATFSQAKPVEADEVAQAIQSALEAVNALREIRHDAQEAAGQPASTSYMAEDDAHFLEAAVRACESSGRQLERLLKRGGDDALLESLRSTAAIVSQELASHYAASNPVESEVGVKVGEAHDASSSILAVKGDDGEVEGTEGGPTVHSNDTRDSGLMANITTQNQFHIGSEHPPGSHSVSADEDASVTAPSSTQPGTAVEHGVEQQDTAAAALAVETVVEVSVQQSDIATTPSTSVVETTTTDGGVFQSSGEVAPCAAVVAVVDGGNGSTTTVTNDVVDGSNASPSSSLFERLPSIDEMQTPPQAHHQHQDAPTSITSSTKKQLEFAPMPWEEEEF